MNFSQHIQFSAPPAAQFCFFPLAHQTLEPRISNSSRAQHSPEKEGIEEPEQGYDREEQNR